MTKDKTSPERTARCTKKKQDKGWLRVYSWAKTEQDRAKIQAYAKKLREKGE